MKKLLLVILLSIVIVSGPVGQEADVPFVHADMIQISYDGLIWAPATALVSNLQIITGQVAATHVKHARRGDIIAFEGQLCGLYAEQKARWLLNTGLIQGNVHKVYVRFKFGSPSMVLDSPYSPASDVVGLTGPPPKPVNTGAVAPSP